METGALGKLYHDGEAIVREGETGDCMYVVQAGQVEVLQGKENKEVRLAVLKEGDFFGEMAIFEREVRSATVCAIGEVRVLTVEKKNFLRRIQEDPSLAYHIVQTMSHRIRELNAELVRMKTTG
jgi:CRP/FNR family transcriptional regulator